jgi:hypothetical protein
MGKKANAQAAATEDAAKTAAEQTGVGAGENENLEAGGDAGADTNTTDTAADTAAPEGAGTDTDAGTEEGSTDGSDTGADGTDGADLNTSGSDTTEDQPAKAPVKIQPHHIAFFEQFVELTKARRSEQAIKAFSNSLKSMFDVGTNDAFNAIYKLFVENEETLTLVTSLQSAAILPHSDRAVVEVVFTVYHILRSKQKDASVNLELVRTLTKNEKFVVWCTKKLGK